MKKIFIMVVSCLLLVGCSLTEEKASDAVKKYLHQYNNLGDIVLADIATLVDSEELNDEQKKVYEDVLKKQYQDLSYEIVNEEYNGDTAEVEVNITVYDLYKAQTDAATYLSNNLDEFNDETGSYDNEKYLDYKLEQMKKTTDTVEYTIDFVVTKNDDKWVVAQPSTDDLEKIHGIYNYDIES
ncbi:MAG: hypothetical protein IJN03_00315 [Bacilli bacterium]|nr:hypothetical protein [Bacilli bacterium]